jgi:CheY-like chemotaxis protein
MSHIDWGLSTHFADARRSPLSVLKHFGIWYEDCAPVFRVGSYRGYPIPGTGTREGFSMRERGQPLTILVADDDADDCYFIKRAWAKSRAVNDLRFVVDGLELTDYLGRLGKYRDPASSPRPGVILLDLYMPRKDGREALREIKSNPELRPIPIVILTTSKAEEDMFRSYDRGANSYITKPVTFEALVDVLRVLGKYWIDIVDLPLDKMEAAEGDGCN